MTFKRFWASFALGLSLSLSLSFPLKAANPNDAPPEVTRLLQEIETAANQKNLEQLLKFYSPNFTTTDGVTYEILKQSLTQLWEQYPNLTYEIELKSWEKDKNQWMVETVTQIQGTGNLGSREMKLVANLTSRQYYENNKLIRQEILKERTDITSGNQPPNVIVKLPDSVKVGQSFDFDVILTQPLNDDLLAGVAIEEMAEEKAYSGVDSFELQLLQAGGLFKRAKAPDKPANYWLSAILIQPEGFRLVSQRLQIKE